MAHAFHIGWNSVREIRELSRFTLEFKEVYLLTRQRVIRSLIVDRGVRWLGRRRKLLALSSRIHRTDDQQGE